jgi:hypothetical protein
MPTTFDSFSSAAAIAPTDYFVGFANTNSNGERKWTYNALLEQIKLDIGQSKAAASAWVNFSVLRVDPYTVTINDNYNVSGVSRGSTGIYKITFTTPIRANSAVCGSAKDSGETAYCVGIESDGSVETIEAGSSPMSSEHVWVGVYSPVSDQYADCSMVSVIVF